MAKAERSIILRRCREPSLACLIAALFRLRVSSASSFRSSVVMVEFRSAATI
jgi:hypothetical protein